MRNALEILNEYRDDSKFPNINGVVYSHSDMLEAISEAQIEAYNKAIKDSLSISIYHKSGYEVVEKIIAKTEALIKHS